MTEFSFSTRWSYFCRGQAYAVFVSGEEKRLA
jgi:hypothetical protein